MSEGNAPSFTHFWFRDDIMPLWEIHVAPRRPNRYLEIGVCEGQSALWMLDNGICREAVGIDPYVEKRRWQTHAAQHLARARANLEPYLASGQFTLIQKRSGAALRALPLNRPFDMIYVDGDHSGHTTLTDMVLSWQLLAIGGLMVVDDLQRRWAHGRPQTLEGVRGFLDGFEKLYTVLYRTERQIGLIKLGPRHP